MPATSLSGDCFASATVVAGDHHDLDTHRTQFTNGASCVISLSVGNG